MSATQETCPLDNGAILKLLCEALLPFKNAYANLSACQKHSISKQFGINRFKPVELIDILKVIEQNGMILWLPAILHEILGPNSSVYKLSLEYLEVINKYKVLECITDFYVG